ncbi:MAG: ATP-binding protein [Pseudomonadota bacterium]
MNGPEERKILQDRNLSAGRADPIGVSAFGADSGSERNNGYQDERVKTLPTSQPSIGTGPVDLRGVLIAIVCGMASFILATVSLALSRFGDGALATVWLPAACAAAFLLRLPLKNEIPYLFALIAGIFFADVAAGFSALTSILFGVANAAEVAVMVAMIRRHCGLQPVMTDINHLGLIVGFGALLAPIASGVIAIVAMAFDMGLVGSSLIRQASNWYLAHGLGIALIVPALLMLADLHRDRASLEGGQLIEGILLISLGLMCSYLVFAQPSSALLFLIPPITLLHAFRLGSLGTAMFLAGLAILAAGMTTLGLGPLSEASASAAFRNQLLQAFLAANFLTGLPVAAALAGRERMTDALERGNQQLAILADNISDAIMHYDFDGNCTYASPSVLPVLGRDHRSFLGSHFADGIHEDAREQMFIVHANLVSGASQTERITYRRYLDSEEGTPVFIEAHCTIVGRIDGTGREGIVVAARDVTERVELELLLTRARRNAENGARAKSEFLANMSHEIRTPMNGVLGFAELLLQTDLNEDQTRQAQMIVQSGRSMMMLLNDVLDLSRIEAGQITIDNGPVDLDTTISECVMLHQPNAEKNGITLVYSPPFALNTAEGDDRQNAQEAMPWVMTDELRLRQIVLNLIGNAVKFTEKGKIAVTLQSNKNEFSISISDTGIGIPADRLTEIFNPFTQAESDTARRFGGTGLGLSISRQLAELLDGRIDVESEHGTGSTFTLVLPAIPATPHSEPEPVSSAPEVLDELPSEARILLAEDHDVNRMLAREMLEKCGQSVAVAHDGNEAISMVMDSILRGSPYDLVLMDMQMPGCDGYEATRAIRAEGITAEQLPIIALTANAFPEDVAAARKAGMQAHLAKPMVFADLARVLQRWLPTRIVEGGSEAIAAASGATDDGPEHAEVVELLHSARRENRAKAGRTDTPPNHSPALIKRWTKRRSEAVEAVRSALGNGVLDGESAEAEKRDALAKLVHKLAGTAAMFGEPDLGSQAAVLENAIRLKLDPKVQKALAQQLLILADGEADEAPQSNVS